MVMLILFKKSHFLYKIHLNTLPFKYVVLGGNGKLSSSSSYPVYSAHRKLRSRSGEGKKIAVHTHRKLW